MANIRLEAAHQIFRGDAKPVTCSSLEGGAKVMLAFQLADGTFAHVRVESVGPSASPR